MKNRMIAMGSLALSLILTVALLMSATAEAPLVVDTNPAIAVAQNTQKSVVGVITNDQRWNRATGETVEDMIGQGSGVVIREGGYILTNNHVVESGSSFQVMLPSGEKVAATLVGADEATDLAVLKVETNEELVPVKIGAASALPVGSTVIAIGNPGGTILANTVTSGVVSALERDVDGRNATHKINYIQHDAAINSGNSGGGLFDVNSKLVGINTLKYGSYYSSGSYEGLGFAIPVEAADAIAKDLIEHGKVLRPAMGVTVANWQGPDEPMNNFPPASVCVYTVNADSPAQQAGMQPYDFITHVNGVRVKDLRELTSELDKHKEGDTVEVTVVRYKNVAALQATDPSLQNDSADGSDNNGGYYTDPFGGYFGNNPFGGYSGRQGRNQQNLGGYEEVKLNVTLKILN